MSTEQGPIADTNQVAYCGLYCGACKRFLGKKCPGCQQNSKATWCKVRSCCIKNEIANCADCKSIGHKACPHFNNFMAKVFGLIFNSDRGKCIERIKEAGYLAYSIEMSEKKAQTIKRK